ncbi:DUF397 domain-containing protein [Streptomyces sp. NPDC002536]
MTSGIAWRKSSYSTQDGGACIEVAWLKSSYSTPEGQACVEIAALPEKVGIRDSKNRSRPAITIPAPAWQAFIVELCNN